MFNLSLKLKFTLLLASYSLVVGIILLLFFKTSENVSNQLGQVRNERFPRYVESTYLANGYAKITRLIEDAVLTGENSLLEKAREEGATFLRHLEELDEQKSDSEDTTVVQIGDDFDTYFPMALELAERMLNAADDEMFYQFSDMGIVEKSRNVSEIRERLKANLANIVNNQKLGVHQALRDTSEQAQSQSRQALLVGAMSLFSLLLFMSITTLKMVKSISTLSSMTAEVAKGNLHLSIDHNLYTGRDEIAKLASSFQKMTLGLQETTVSKNLVDTIIQSMTDTLVVVDLQGKIQMVNEATIKLLGYEKGELVGTPVKILFHERTNEPISEDFKEELLTKGKDGRKETLYVTKYGGKIAVSFYHCPMYDERGEILGTLYVAQDITERKRIEAELLTAKNQAVSASRAKSEFLANMSHEIRTPMNGVIGMNGLLLDTKLSSEQRSYAQTVASSAEALLTIINEILDFSKIEAGELSIESIAFDLQQTVEEIVDLLSSRVVDKDCELILRVALNVPRNVIGDPGRIRQILNNLAGNSIKFTEKGHVLINVEPVEQTHEKVKVQFEIEDTGIGIPEDKIDTMFEKFTQADGSTSRKYGGTGLGLAITKQLTELMGGSITATSHVGGGTKFKFVLPFEITKDLPAVSMPKADLSGVRILIVDDIHLNRMLLAELLHSWKITNQTCSSGKEAILMLRKAHLSGNPFDIALLDHQMPGMNGEELCTTIKEDVSLQKTIVVMLTSLGRTKGAKRLEEIGFAGYLLKPIRQSQLFEVLSKVWGARKMQKSIGLITEHHCSNDSRSSRALTKHHCQNESGATRVSIKHHSHLRVLVAEDNLVNQKVAVRTLEQLGYPAIDVATNGKEAVDMSGKNMYDLILMDCQMPEMNGYEATRAIRKRESNGQFHIPIIAMTANAMKGDREECLDAGMDDYVSKPVNRDLLRDVLQKWDSHVKDKV